MAYTTSNKTVKQFINFNIKSTIGYFPLVIDFFYSLFIDFTSGAERHAITQKIGIFTSLKYSNKYPKRYKVYLFK